ncbi:unnamed protein product [Rotaria sordida]|uniref:Peptidase S9 prolyl oligopeptidase catalytic domain-containing protein n=2 Tax=Rotaria sordida TaxID=392033 RepID=A0A818NWT9_9BILA|nr:unnamed protein product [Rotaria sordida]
MYTTASQFNSHRIPEKFPETSQESVLQLGHQVMVETEPNKYRKPSLKPMASSNFTAALTPQYVSNSNNYSHLQPTSNNPMYSMHPKPLQAMASMPMFKISKYIRCENLATDKDPSYLPIDDQILICQSQSISSYEADQFKITLVNAILFINYLIPNPTIICLLNDGASSNINIHSINNNIFLFIHKNILQPSNIYLYLSSISIQSITNHNKNLLSKIRMSSSFEKFLFIDADNEIVWEWHIPSTNGTNKKVPFAFSLFTHNSPQNNCYSDHMIKWTAGHTNMNQRFKAFVNHHVLFDMRHMAYSTDELWFIEYDTGSFTQHDNLQAFETYNPINYVTNWAQSLLVIHETYDYRILDTQHTMVF